MAVLEGVISFIELENNNGNDKKVVTLKIGNRETVFIEFQGKSLNKVIKFREGDNVSISVFFNGKKSKLGRKYNNLIGKSIKQKS